MGEDIRTISKAARKTDRSYQRDTERGMNRQETYTVARLESQIRNRKTEKGYVIDEQGNIVTESYKGGKHSARFRSSEIKSNTILTHNHPTGEGSGLHGTLAGRIGVPFSMADMQNAVQFNLKEVRAVTPTYTYSLRRPKGGWGNGTEVMKALNDYNRTVRREADRYARGQVRLGVKDYRRAYEINDRANVGIQYSEMKKIAKRFGWEFTRKKVK